MSDLEKQIAQWRDSLAGSETMLNSDIDELENHLREEMETLSASGLSQDEAFLVARHRLGDAATLKEEFVKVNGSGYLTNQLWWMIAGVLGYLLAAHFGSVASSASRAITQATDVGPSVCALIAGGMRIGAFCAVGAFALHLCVRCSRPALRPPVRITRRVRMAVLLALFVDTLGLFITQGFGTPRPGYAWAIPTPQDYVHIATLESPRDAACRLVGAVLLGTLLIVIHLAGRRETQTQ